MGGHEHAVAGDLQQPVDGLHIHALTGEMTANVVPVFEDADSSGAVDPSCDRGPCRLWFALWLELWVEHVGGRALHQLEASDRRYVTDRLVLALGVIDPGIQLRLGLLDRVERTTVEQFFANRLVQPFDLAGGRRRVRRGQDVADPLARQIRSKATVAGLWASLPVNTLPLSVRISTGIP